MEFTLALVDNKTICFLPWNHLATRSSGEYRLCCLAEHSGSVLKSSAGEPLRADTHDFNDVRNSELLKEVRRTMIKGEWHSICSKCKTEEAVGLNSRRKIYREKESAACSDETILKHTAEDGSIDSKNFPLETFDIRLGNLCNLKCRMCEPIYSTKWYSDYEQLTGQDHFYSGPDKIYFRSKDLKNFEWFESAQFWGQLSHQGQHIKHIYMIGGEPLLIQKQTGFLQNLVERNLASQIELEYNTNLTYLHDQQLELWKQFKKVTLGVSIESFGDENDYIRHPSQFSEIVENLRRVDQLSSPQLRIWIATTFQVFNAYSLPKMIDWVLAQKFRFIEDFPNSPILHLHPLHNPDYYSLQSLPLDAKKKVEELYRKKAEELLQLSQSSGKRSYEKTSKQLLSAVEFMNRKDSSEKMRQFLQVTASLDKLRKENFRETFPELAADLGITSGS